MLNILQELLSLQKIQDEYYWDEDNLGYFFSPSDGEELITKTKEVYDGAIPSGNSVSAMNLLKLGRILAKTEYENRSIDIGIAFSSQVKKRAISSAMLLSAVDYSLGPAYEIIFVSKSDFADDDIIHRINETFIPNKVILFVNESIEDNVIYDLAGYTKNYTAVDNKTTAYICQNYTCNLPVTDPDEVLELIK